MYARCKKSLLKLALLSSCFFFSACNNFLWQKPANPDLNVTAGSAVLVLPPSHFFGVSALNIALDKKISLSNTGSAKATEIVVSLKENAATFSLVAGGTCNSELEAGASCEIAVRYLPTSAATESAKIEVAYKDGSESKAVSVIVSATGAVVGSLVLSDLTCDYFGCNNFGENPIGGSIDKKYRLQNTGGSAINQISFASIALPYSYQGGCGTELAAGAFCDPVFRFAPTAVGQIDTMLSVQFQSLGQSRSIAQAVVGIGRSPGLLALDSRSVTDIGPTVVGSNRIFPLVIKNTGEFPVTAPKIRYQDGSPFKQYIGPNAYYQYMRPCGEHSVSYRTGEGCAFTMLYDAKIAGAVNGTVFIDYFNGVETKTLEVNLVGRSVSPLAGTPARQTLVLYNQNASESLEIANYYATQRGIPSNQICGVQLPPGLYAHWTQLLGARRKIIRDCLCPLIPAANRPNPCDETQVSRIAERSPIAYLAYIKGLPHRVTGTGYVYDYEDPSLDHYLSLLIYRPLESIEAETGYVLAVENGLKDFGSDIATSETGLIHRPHPAVDRMAVYGRIEAINKQRTMELIDRTLVAERQGISGNFLAAAQDGFASRPEEDILGTFMRDLAGAQTASCRDYIKSDDPWPYLQCRAGISANGKIPASDVLTIKRAINASCYLGYNFQLNNQASFNYDFASMLKWHKSQYDCVELCKDLPTQSEQTECRNRSTDYFKEINTDCVGVGRGFIGHQYRSYPVQYYGFYPQGWHAGSSGDEEKRPPRVIDTGGFQNARFTDTKFIRFGVEDAIASPMCSLGDGTSAACPEYIPVSLMRYLAPMATAGNLKFRVRFRYRNPANPNGGIKIDVRYLDSSREPISLEVSPLISMATANSEWQTAQFDTAGFNLDNPPDGKRLSHFWVRFSAKFSERLRRYLDIDGVEIIELDAQGNEGRHYLAADAGSFATPFYAAPSNANSRLLLDNTINTNGDYAGQMIDRLGAVAWWGSGSHFGTNGHAFAYSPRFAGSFFAGSTLAESVLSMRGGSSGVIYGDPLYSPIGVRMFLDITNTEIYKPAAGFQETQDRNYAGETKRFRGYQLHAQRPATFQRPIRINAIHGRARTAQTRWQIERCVTEYFPELCSQNGQWTVYRQGTTGGENLSTGITNLQDLVPNRNLPGPVFLRLKVWVVGEESNAIYNMAQFHHVLGRPYPQLIGDIDGDACITYDDLYTWNNLDLNGDGKGDDTDLNLIVNNVGKCLPLR